MGTIYLLSPWCPERAVRLQAGAEAPVSNRLIDTAPMGRTQGAPSAWPLQGGEWLLLLCQGCRDGTPVPSASTKGNIVWIKCSRSAISEPARMALA